MSISIKKFTFNPFQENTYLLYDNTKSAILIDCGCGVDNEEKDVISFITENKLNLTHHICTHLHFDHVLGASFVKNHFGLSPEANIGDEFFYKETKTLAKERLGIELKEDVPSIDNYLDEGIFSFGESELQMVHVPGHSPGSLVFYSPNDKFAIVGDVIFKGSIGRTDLWCGDYDTLISGIKRKIFTLPEDTKLLSGHGPSTTVQNEKINNPFFN